MQTIVIGLGNPILGDDGAGWKIAEQVAERLAAQPVNREQEIDVACLGVGGLSLMEHLIGYDRAILIDTILTEKSPPGTVYQFPLEQMVGAPTGHLASTHDTTLQNALRVGQTMGAKLPDQITVIAVEAYNVYDFSDELSPPIAQAVNQAVQLVMEQIQ